MNRTKYIHTGEIKKMCNNEQIPTNRSNFDQAYLKFYNPLALDTRTFPPDNPEQLRNFYGVPTNLNIVDEKENGKFIFLS